MGIAAAPIVVVIEGNAEDSALGNQDDAQERTGGEKRRRRNPGPVNDGSPKRRKLMVQKWKTTVAKEAYAKGIAHVSMRGKFIPEKVLGASCPQSCPRKCSSKVSEAERREIFNHYYSILDHSRKWDFIGRLVKSSPVKRRTTNDDHSRRQNSFSYFLQLSNNERVEVCQRFFVSTLAISQQVVKTALSKMKNKGGVISPDKRGKYAKKRVIDSAVRDNVKAHIASFKTMESHYTRKRSKSKFLPDNLNVRKMHTLYKIMRGDIPKTANLRQYRDIFKADFNLKFFKPKKDQCSTCLNWKNRTTQEKNKKGEEEKFQKHIDNKTKGNELKEADSARALEEKKELCVASYDFQKILHCPKGENAAFFYKSKLRCYNFTIFEHGIKQGHCYVWDQTLAGKGALEVASCLYLFISKKIDEGVKEFIFYSDNCPSQNKNSIVFSMFNIVSVKYNVDITQRFLEKGHTHMEVDSVHACIERKCKNIEVHTPAQWYALIKLAKQALPKYRVQEINQEDILDFKEVASHHNWTKVGTSQVRELKIKHNSVIFKKDYSGISQTQSLLPAKVGRPVNWNTFKLKRVYLKKVPVKKEELEDLMWYCRAGHIPSASLPFYQSIEAISDEQNGPQDPVDCSESSSDECSSSESSSEEDSDEVSD
jgi:hypothetical protein